MKFTPSPYSIFAQVFLLIAFPLSSFLSNYPLFMYLLHHNPVYLTSEFFLVHLCCFHQKVSSTRGETFPALLPVSLFCIDQCFRQKMYLWIYRDGTVDSSNFFGCISGNTDEGMGKIVKRRWQIKAMSLSGCNWRLNPLETLCDTVWNLPQSYPTKSRKRLGYLSVPISHWLMFLRGGINSSALLIYP